MGEARGKEGVGGGRGVKCVCVCCASIDYCSLKISVWNSNSEKPTNLCRQLIAKRTPVLDYL